MSNESRSEDALSTDTPAPVGKGIVETFEAASTIGLPQNADQAVWMWLIGERWVRENAPERLKPVPTTPDAGAVERLVEALKDAAYTAGYGCGRWGEVSQHRDAVTRATENLLAAFRATQSQAPAETGWASSQVVDAFLTEYRDRARLNRDEFEAVKADLSAILRATQSQAPAGEAPMRWNLPPSDSRVFENRAGAVDEPVPFQVDEGEGAEPDPNEERNEGGRVTILPTALWRALDAEAEIWAKETDIASWVAKMSPDARSREKLKAIVSLCFEEGFYRGALAAKDGRSINDSLEDVAALRTHKRETGEGAFGCTESTCDHLQHAAGSNWACPEVGCGVTRNTIRTHKRESNADPVKDKMLANIKRASDELDAVFPPVVHADTDRLDFLQWAARNSQTGISFDYVPSVDGEPSGWRFMRRFFIGPTRKSLREAIDAAREDVERLPRIDKSPTPQEREGGK